MTSTRIAEAKGILLLVFIIALLAAVMMATSGKLEDWFGIKLFRSPDVAGKITFVSDRNGHNDIWIMESDGSGQKPLTNDEFDDKSPVWSPDGTEIVFISNRDEGRYQLYAVSYKGGRVRKLSQSSGTKSNPVFSPDNKEITFLNAGKVSIREVDGKHEHQVLPTEEQARAGMLQDQKISFSEVDWSSTGNWLAAVNRLEPGEAVVMLDLRSGESGVSHDDEGRPLAGEEIDIAWSNSGERLAVAVRKGSIGNYAGVVDLDRETYYPILISEDAKHVLMEPSWSADDSAVALVTALIDKEGQITRTGLLVTDSSGETSSQIVDGSIEKPKWSRKGNRIIYTKNTGGKRDVWIVDVDNPKPVNLTKGKGNNFDASWAPGVPK